MCFQLTPLLPCPPPCVSDSMGLGECGGRRRILFLMSSPVALTSLVAMVENHGSEWSLQTDGGLFPVCAIFKQVDSETRKAQGGPGIGRLAALSS